MECLTEKVQHLIASYGQNGYQIAKASVLNDNRITKPVKQVLNYFITESWPNMQHPALISLACEAVGGERNASNEISAALVLLTGAADIHDDIIDKSKTKASKLTAYGKFGKDLVLLAGDILLLKALTKLGKSSEKYSFKKRATIRNLIEDAFVEIACATATERHFISNFNIDPTEYKKIIFLKGSVSDAFARIGAIIGDGKKKEVAALGHFGRTLSTLTTIRTEFLDLENYIELENRIQNEVLPLPVLCALQNESVRNTLLALLKDKITVKKTEKIANITLSTREVKVLKEEVRSIAEKEEYTLKAINRNTELFRMLLKVSVFDL